MIPSRLKIIYSSHGTVLTRKVGRDATFWKPRTELSLRWLSSRMQPPLSNSANKDETTIPRNQRHMSPREVFLQKDQYPARYDTRNLKDRTKALLELPPGRMDDGTWRQVKGMIDTWTRRGSVHSARMAEKLLERLVKEAAVNDYVKLSATVYNQVMNAWTRSRAPDAPLRVDAILQRMQSRYDAAPGKDPEPDTISFNTVLHTWADSEDERATERAEELIYLMEERHRMNPSGAVKPTTWSYNLVMLAYANRIGEYGAAKSAEDWLLRLSELNIENGPRPDSYSFTIVLTAWANSLEEKGPDRALELLRLFIKLSNDGHDMHPGVSSFTTVISAYAKLGQVMKAQEVLYLIREVDFPKGTNITPCFNAVIDSWAKSGAKDAGHMAEIVLNNAQSFSSTDTSVVVAPNVITYTSCMDAHARSDNPHALENAEDFLRRMIELFRSGERKVGPTSKTFICIISAWARSDRENRAEKAEWWLREMNNMSRIESFKCAPNSMAFNICIDTWAHSGLPNASARASTLLREMEEAYEKGNRHARPNGFSYRIVIKQLLSTGQKKDALEALHLVKRMEEQTLQGNTDARPDTATCNKVIDRLTQIGDEETIKAALNLIRWMDQASHMRPDTWTFTTVISALSVLSNTDAKFAAVRLYGRMEELSAMERSSVHLTSDITKIVLKILSDLGGKHSADRALSIFDRISRQADANKPVNLLNSLSLTICLEALLEVGTPEYTLRAHELLKDMIRRYRNRTSTNMPMRGGFAAVVDALAESKLENTVDLVQEILDLLRDIPFDGYFYQGPGTMFYSKVIDLLIQHDHLEKAEGVLLSWENKCFLFEGVERPNAIVWNKLIRAWSKSSSEGKVTRARALLDRMKECANQGTGGALPDLTSYNTVLNAASFASSNYEVRQDAFRIAKATYEEMKEPRLFFRPDEVTYGTMLKAIGRLMSHGNDKKDFSIAVFKECCANGQNGPMVMKEIRKNLADSEIRAICKEVLLSPQPNSAADISEAS